MRTVLLPIALLTLAAASLGGLSSCGHTLYGMSLDMERMRSYTPQTGQRYRSQQEPYQYPQQSAPPPVNNGGYNYTY